jgi:hypothetical protein
LVQRLPGGKAFALSLPEFIQSAEPKAEQFLKKVLNLKIPATDSAEVAAKPASALMEDSHVYIRHLG